MTNTEKLDAMIKDINSSDSEFAKGKVWEFAQTGEMVENIIKLDPMYRFHRFPGDMANRIARAILDNIKNASLGYPPEMMMEKCIKEIQTLLDSIRKNALEEAINSINKLNQDVK